MFVCPYSIGVVEGQVNRPKLIKRMMVGRCWAEVDGTEALREVLRRYLSAYGPAMHREFAHWFGMPLAEHWT